MSTIPSAKALLRPVLVAGLLLVVAVGDAAAQNATSTSGGSDPYVTENITAMKRDIVSTFATWIPFVVLFTLLGIAMATIGLRLFNGGS